MNEEFVYQTQEAIRRHAADIAVMRAMVRALIATHPKPKEAVDIFIKTVNEQMNAPFGDFLGELSLVDMARPQQSDVERFAHLWFEEVQKVAP